MRCDYATQFYNLSTDVNMPCELFNRIVEIQILATTEHVATCRSIYSTVVIQLQVNVRCPAAELKVNSVYYRLLIGAFGQLHSTRVFMYSLVKHHFLSIYLCTPSIKFICVCSCVC